MEETLSKVDAITFILTKNNDFIAVFAGTKIEILVLFGSKVEQTYLELEVFEICLLGTTARAENSLELSLIAEIFLHK